MALKESIKSAIKRQSLVWKALAFGAAWLFLPFWLFLIAALYLYLLPFFKPLSMFLQFLAVLFFAWTWSGGVLYALFLALLFYLILGLKDLVFTEKRPMLEILALFIMFMIFNGLFRKFGEWGGAAVFFWTFVSAAVFFLLTRSYLRSGNLPGRVGEDLAAKRRLQSIAAAIAAIAVFEVSLAVIFLPLSSFYQMATVFLSAALLLEFAGDYFSETLTRRVILVDFSVFFGFVVVILGLAPWGL